MAYINLTQEEQNELQRLLKESPSPRARAQALLLSNDGYSMNELAKIGFVDSETNYKWFRKHFANSFLPISFAESTHHVKKAMASSIIFAPHKFIKH